MAGGNPQRLPSSQEQKLMWDLYEEGYSVREIARQTGWGQSTVSRRLSKMGADTDRSKTAEATAARVRKLREKRVDLAEKLMNDVESMRQRVWDEYVQIATGPDGPAKVHLDEPPLKEQADGVKAVDSYIASIDRLLNGAEQAETDVSSNVLTNIMEGLKELIDSDPDAGLSELDRDHDYDIALDPEQQQPEQHMAGGK